MFVVISAELRTLCLNLSCFLRMLSNERLDSSWFWDDWGECVPSDEVPDGEIDIDEFGELPDECKSGVTWNRIKVLH